MQAKASGPFFVIVKLTLRNTASESEPVATNSVVPADRQTDRQAGRQADGQTDRDRQAGRQNAHGRSLNAITS